MKDKPKSMMHNIRIQLKLLWIDKKRSKNIFFMILAFIFILLTVSTFSYYTSTAEEDLNLRFSDEKEEVFEEKKPSHKSIIYEYTLGTQQNKNYLVKTKTQFLQIPSSSDESIERKLIYTLNKLSISRKNSVSILPIGDLDYVRRDLPVYKLAVDEHPDVQILQRPKGGMYIQKQIKTKVNILLCLSFNTNHCISKYPNQKIILNRIPFLRDVLWSKDKFCETMKNSPVKDFILPCFIMPTDYQKLLKFSESKIFISKPRSLGGGKGIYVISSHSDLVHERRTNNLVQEYVTNPHLITKEDGNKYKYDLRTYVLVTSVSPLRAYVYNRGLVRISTGSYNKQDILKGKCSRNSGDEDKKSCLTNTSLNKKKENITSEVQDRNKLKDITWSFKKLKTYVNKEDPQTWNLMFERLQRAIGLMLLSSEKSFSDLFEENKLDGNYYQLLGVDVLFDDNLSPKIVEVNGEPSMRLTTNKRSHYDVTKKKMISDLVKIVTVKQTDKVASEVGEKFLDWGADGNKELKYIGKSGLEYLMKVFEERDVIRKDKLGFKPVYPSKNEDLMDEYAKVIRGIWKEEMEERIRIHYLVDYFS
eukprot:snap_masked-scaffold_10-processed-gene-3.27-mRNA-1 protein AED:0.42 eAED:0.46 QI:0/-1/0/1/-1/1/1/0/587